MKESELTYTNNRCLEGNEASNNQAYRKPLCDEAFLATMLCSAKLKRGWHLQRFTLAMRTYHLRGMCTLDITPLPAHRHTIGVMHRGFWRGGPNILRLAVLGSFLQYEASLRSRRYQAPLPAHVGTAA